MSSHRFSIIFRFPANSSTFAQLALSKHCRSRQSSTSSYFRPSNFPKVQNFRCGIPIYYLEPNTLIKVYSEKNNINGEYEMTRFTIPLNYNGMMNISAQKVFR